MVIELWSLQGGQLITTVAVSFAAGYLLKSRWVPILYHRLFTSRSGSSFKLALVVRSDLGMKKGKIAAQCSHAAVSCYKEAYLKQPKQLQVWEDCGQPKIVLRFDGIGEEGLQKIGQEAAKYGLITAIIRDAGHTQVSAGSATVLGIGPGNAEVIDKVTSHLKLL